MITQKLKNIFFVSVLVFFGHIIEELITGLYVVDPITYWLSRWFSSIPQAVYIISNIELLLFLMVVACLVKGGKCVRVPWILFGILLVAEVDHLVRTIAAGRYYPGFITSLVFPILAVLFWKELIKIIHHKA